MGTLSIIGLCLLFLLNGVTIGISYQEDMRYQLDWRAFLAIFIGIFIGAPVLLLRIVYDTLIIFWKDYIWNEISFYWKFYRTTFFDDIIAKNPNALWDWNRLYRAHEPESWVRKKLKRHVTLLNKKYKYDYETDKQNREHKQKQDEKDWD